MRDISLNALYVGNLGLNKTDFIKHVQQLWINIGSKQNIEHDYDRIYDMFDLSRILRIRYKEYLDKAFMAALPQQQQS